MIRFKKPWTSRTPRTPKPTPNLRELHLKKAATLRRLATLRQGRLVEPFDVAPRPTAPVRRAPTPQPKPPVRDAQSRLVARVQTLGTWAGDPELSALSKVYKLCIRVWQKLPTGMYRTLQTYGQSNNKSIDITYRHGHYAPMVNVVRQGRWHAEASEVTTPADGDCLYHAIAHAAGFPELSLICDAYQFGGMGYLRQNRHIMAWVDHPERMTDDQLYLALRQCYVHQMRHDAAQELSGEVYQVFADHV